MLREEKERKKGIGENKRSMKSKIEGTGPVVFKEERRLREVEIMR